MFETIPALYGPQIDIILIIVVFNIISYAVYYRIYGKNFAAAANVDFKVSIIEILLLVIMYAGHGVTVLAFGDQLAWYWWYIVVSLPIEIIFFLGYRRLLGLSWEEMFGSKQ